MSITADNQTTQPSPMPPRLSPTIAGKLKALRRRIRRYVAVSSLGLIVAWLGLVFWVTLAIDWLPVSMGYDEPEGAIRLSLLILAGVGLLWLLFRGLARIARPLTDRAMAVVLERRFREFDDSLLTTVELTAQPEHAAQFSPDMLRHTSELAVHRAAEVPIGKVFNPRPLIRNVGLGILLAGSVAAFAAAAPERFEIWTRRMLLLDDVKWPRQSYIVIDGPMERRVARGGDVELLVKASAAHEVPSSVRVEWQNEDGTSGYAEFDREGDEPRDGWQYYTYRFTGLRGSLTYDVVGGDFRVRNYRIVVVDSPTAELSLHAEFPEYMVDEEQGLNTPRDIPVSEVVEVYQGTRLTIRGTANKPLLEAEVTTTDSSGYETRRPLALFSPQQQETLRAAYLASGVAGGMATLQEIAPRQFEYVISALQEDLTLKFTLVDADGLPSGEPPIRLALAARADDIPHVELSPLGIGSAVTVDVRIPIVGRIWDDHGLVRTWLEYNVNEQPTVRIPFEITRAGAAGEAVARLYLSGFPGPLPKGVVERVYRDNTQVVLDFRDFRRAELRAAEERQKPSDDDTEAPWFPPNAPDWLTDPNLKGRFELQPGQTIRLYVKAEDRCTLDSGSRVGTSQEIRLRVVTPEELRSILAEKEDTERQQYQRIVDVVLNCLTWLQEIPYERQDLSAVGEGGELPSEKAQRVQQVCVENAAKILEVAQRFDGIRLELQNNRLQDTEELERRLRDDISIPLKEIGGPMFDEFNRRMNDLVPKLHQDFTDDAARVAALRSAKQQLDAIVTAMEEVLYKMEEFQSFNRVLARIRELVELQKKLKQSTEAYRNWKLLNPDDE